MEASIIPLIYNKIEKSYFWWVILCLIISSILSSISTDLITKNLLKYPISIPPLDFHSVDRWIDRIWIFFFYSASTSFKIKIFRIKQFSLLKKFLIFIPPIFIVFLLRNTSFLLYFILNNLILPIYIGIGVASQLLFWSDRASESINKILPSETEASERKKVFEKTILPIAHQEDGNDMVIPQNAVKNEIQENIKNITLRKLAGKYADGEISKEEYERLKKILEE
jgi:hypothetical protein